jgi:hypothetical protein
MSSVASGLRPFGMVFFALTLILLFASSRASADTVDTYVFSGASAVLGVAPETVALETITGGFTFDATTNEVSAVDITLTGNSAYAGSFTASSLSDGGLPFDVLNPVVNAGVTAFINLTFASDFGASPDLWLVSTGSPRPEVVGVGFRLATWKVRSSSLAPPSPPCPSLPPMASL